MPLGTFPDPPQNVPADKCPVSPYLCHKWGGCPTHRFFPNTNRLNTTQRNDITFDRFSRTNIDFVGFLDHFNRSRNQSRTETRRIWRTAHGFTGRAPSGPNYPQLAAKGALHYPKFLLQRRRPVRHDVDYDGWQTFILQFSLCCAPT